MSAEHSGLRARFISEMKMMLVIFIYLSALFGSLTIYRRIVLDIYQINYFHYGYSFIEALVLSKIIVFGTALGLGERFRGRPLIFPTAYKTLIFCIVTMAFMTAEHVVTGWVEGKSTRDAWDGILNQGMYEILSRIHVMFLAFLPMFAVWETSRALGDGKLYALFFRPSTRDHAPPGSHNHGAVVDVGSSLPSSYLPPSRTNV